MKRILKPLIYVILAVGLIAAAVWGFMPTAVPVDTAKVTRGSLRVTVDEDGKTRIKEKYVVSAPLGGRLTRIDLHAGDEVRAGTTLLSRIEPTDPTLLDARERTVQQARVRAAEATVQQTDAAMSRSQAALDLAETEFGRAQQLLTRSAVSQEEVDEKRMQYRTWQAEYKAARFGLDIANFELEQAKAALLQIDPHEGGPSQNPHFEIRSPIDGRVLRVLQESTTIVQPGMPLLEIGDPLDLEIEIDVLSADAVRVQPGTKVTLEHWGGEQPLSGIVRVIEPSAFTKISALGVEEQRTNVIVDFDDPPERRKSLGDGFRVDARITIWQSDDVLKVPVGAIFRQGDESAVFTVREGRVEVRTVELGRRNDVEAEVLNGLSVDESVILHPSDRILDGVRVTPR